MRQKLPWKLAVLASELFLSRQGRVPEARESAYKR